MLQQHPIAMIDNEHLWLQQMPTLATRSSHQLQVLLATYFFATIANECDLVATSTCCNQIGSIATFSRPCTRVRI